MKWVRYIFQTQAVDDYRPLVYNPAYPWWRSGESADGEYVTIIAWLPDYEELQTYYAYP
jgi:hypothetical protein